MDIPEPGDILEVINAERGSKISNGQHYTFLSLYSGRSDMYNIDLGEGDRVNSFFAYRFKIVRRKCLLNGIQL